MPEAAAPPVELTCKSEGRGTPILLLHGMGGDHTVWNSVTAPLGARHEVLVPDLRGHGRSPAPPGSTYSFAEMEGDVLALLDARQKAQVDVVGLSAGGFLALRLALDHPDRVRSLVVIGASSHCDNHTKAVAERWAEVYQTEGFDAYVLRLLKDLFYPDWVEAHMDYADAMKERLRGVDLKGPLQWGLAVRTFDLRGRLGRLRVPTFIIHGVDDQVIDSAHARLLRVSIPGAQLRLFPLTGHLPPVEKPTETTQAIAEWVDREGPAAGAAAAVA
ncbi:MAG: alpha/beta hydrolase [Thermoplasmata archaeon]|nr:alpha/beta hydrolase [Thermoplasmata archaeon]